MINPPILPSSANFSNSGPPFLLVNWSPWPASHQSALKSLGTPKGSMLVVEHCTVLSRPLYMPFCGFRSAFSALTAISRIDLCPAHLPRLSPVHGLPCCRVYVASGIAS